ncbi:MAG TPA: ATP-binding protein [Parasulfuritortus sp.]
MSSTARRPLLSRSIALRLTLFYVLFFALATLAGGMLLYHLVERHVLSELDGDIARQKDEFVRVIRYGDLAEVGDAFAAYEKASGKDDCFARLIDRQGRVLLATNMTDWPDMPLPGAQWSRLPGRQSDFATVPLPDYRQKARLLSVAVPNVGYLQLGVSLEESEILFDHFSRFGMVILAVMLMLGTPIGWLLARKAMSGVEVVARTASSVADGHFSDRVEVSGYGQEIDDLVVSFNRMVERVQAVMGEMRQVNDNIAHDLRSPLTRIRGLAEQAAVNGGQTADAAEVAGNIVEECDRLMQMINTMLDISEAETGVGRLHREPVDLPVLLDQAVELFAGVAEDKGVTLSAEHGAEAGVMAGDRRKLQRAIANLVDNAIKYTPAGGRVRLGLHREPGHIRVEVSDTGIGIEARDLPRIFERFYRCDESRHQAGNGLGLSLAQAIARSHGGGISVDSSPGRGSVFTLILPA